MLFVSAVMLATFTGCSKQNESETEFQAYYKPLTSDDVAVEGDIYYASSQILLTSVNDASYKDIKKLVKKNGGEIIGYISFTGDYQVRFSNSETFEELEQLVEDLKDNVLVEDASLAYVAQFQSESVNYTNDPWIDADDPSDASGSVWDEDNPEGKNWWAEAIDMPTVWDMDLFTQTVKVGIIDSMFDTANEDLDEDLFAKTWYNPTNEDGACKVTQLYNDAVAAYEQALSSGNQDAIDSASDRVGDTSHGTHVAGIIAAQADNGFGITGVNQNVKLYGYSVKSDEHASSEEESQWVSIFTYKCAIANLLNEGVRVINISMGWNDALTGTQEGDSYCSAFTSANSKSLESFLLKYIEAGEEFLIIKSAGNDSNKEYNKEKVYYAENDLFGSISNEQVAQRIIMVGAAKYNAEYGYYQITDFSNRGDRVDVYAPGEAILSDIPSNATALMKGTSMSTPIVTGLASLIWGINPDLSSEQVRNIILASTSASIFDFDDKSFIIRDLINWIGNPTAIVNANICVQLAQGTIGDNSTSDAEYGTVLGMVYAVRSDKKDLVDINIENFSLYDKNGDFVLTIPLQDSPRRVTDNIHNIYTYSLLLEPGTYTLKAEVEGYESQTQQIVVDADCVIKVGFEFINTFLEELTDGYWDAIIGPQEYITYKFNDDGTVQYGFFTDSSYSYNGELFWRKCEVSENSLTECGTYTVNGNAIRIQEKYYTISLTYMDAQEALNSDAAKEAATHLSEAIDNNFYTGKVLFEINFDPYEKLGEFYNYELQNPYCLVHHGALEESYNIAKEKGLVADVPDDSTYIDALKEIMKGYQKDDDYTESNQYYRYDLDQDNIDELIIKIGNCEMAYKYLFFDITNNGYSKLGETNAFYSILRYSEDGKLYRTVGHIDMQAYEITKENGQINEMQMYEGDYEIADGYIYPEEIESATILEGVYIEAVLK